MQLLDRVLGWNDENLWARVLPGEHSLFTSDRGVPTCIGLEYLAQASAAFFTVYASVYNPSTVVRAGMFIAARQYDAERAHFDLNVPLVVHVRLRSRVPTDASQSSLVKFSGEVFESAELPSSANGGGVVDRIDATHADKLAKGVSLAHGDLSVYI